MREGASGHPESGPTPLCPLSGTHGFLQWLTAPSRRLHYSAGTTITEDMRDAIVKVPAGAWTPTYDSDGQVRDAAWVADIIGLLDLAGWPAAMRVIVRKERYTRGSAAVHRPRRAPVHRLRHDANKGQLADLELWHRRRARCEDRIRCAKDTGLRNLPPQGLRPQSAVVRDRRPGLCAARLDPAARPARDHPPRGTQTASATAALRRLAPRPRRPPSAAASGRTLALGPPDHRRHHPSSGLPSG